MKIYSITRNSDRRAERRIIPAGLSGLKKAAGGEDILILTDEAMNSFRRDILDKNREQELKELAFRHINDYNPEIANPENDPEFVKAEKLVLLAELVIRVAPSTKGANIYERITDFVVEQLTDPK